MTSVEQTIDIHCHILPGVDDGAGGWEESLAMARMAVADGIGTIVATPHQLGGNRNLDGRIIRELVAEFQQILHERRIPLTVLPGADVRIEPDMIAKLRAGEVVTLADRGRHVLLELPHDVFLPLDRPLRELRAVGLTGILSHPERNLGILGNPAVLHGLVDSGCLLQITAGSLTGSFGARVQGLAEWIVKQGLVHFVATDAHNTKSRPPQLAAARRRIAELAGEDLATESCCGNPRRVADGAPVASGVRQVKKPGWSWFRRKAG